MAKEKIMKKTITLITLISMMLVTMFAFSACGNKQEEAKAEEPVAEAQTENNTEKEEENTEEVPKYTVEGTYINIDERPIGDRVEEIETIFTFNSDKSFKYEFPTDNFLVEGTYEVKDDKVYTYFDDKEVVVEIVDEKTLKSYSTVDDGEKTYKKEVLFIKQQEHYSSNKKEWM